MIEKGTITRRTATKLLALGASSYLVNPLIITQKELLMQTRNIPSSNEKIPIVGLGTWQSFDVGTAQKERQPLKDVLQVLIDHGGSVIDSSPMYGRSEEVVGKLTSEMKLKDKLFKATKVWVTGKDSGIEQMNESFDLMKVRQMDLMQIHNMLDWKTHIKILRNWKDNGKVKYLGVTHYHSGAYAEMEQIMKSEPLDFIQINYNIAVRGAADRILPLASDKGIAVIINRPYEGGGLFRVIRDQELPVWANEFDANSWGQFFLKFILANPSVTCVIPGTSKAKHMRDNVQAGFGVLPNGEHLRMMVKLIES